MFFGLKRLPKSGLAGETVAEAAGAAEASAFLWPRVFGEADASGLAAALGEASAFLRLRFAGEAEASGLAIAAGDVSAFLRPRALAGDAEASGLVAGEVSAFLRPRFFAGEADASGLALGDSAGVCASTKETQAKMVINKTRARVIVMEPRLEARADIRQR